MASLADIQQQEDEANAEILNANKPTTLDDKDTDEKKETLVGDPKAELPANNSDSELLWEQKYKSLQGKYNVDVPRLTRQLKEKSDSSAEVTRLNGELQAKDAQIRELETKLQQAPSGSVDTKDDLSKQMEEEYGPELAQSIEQLIQRRLQAAPQNSDELSQLRSRVETVEKSGQASNEDMKFKSLSSTLKANNIDFNQVNDDPQFHEWLALEEGSTGQSRQQFLTSNFEQGDIDRTAAFYINFKAHERSLLAKGNPLDGHVDVSSNNASLENNTNEDIWTKADADRLYEDYRTKRISEAEFTKYEQQLFRAQASGNYHE